MDVLISTGSALYNRIDCTQIKELIKFEMWEGHRWSKLFIHQRLYSWVKHKKRKCDTRYSGSNGELKKENRNIRARKLQRYRIGSNGNLERKADRWSYLRRLETNWMPLLRRRSGLFRHIHFLLHDKVYSPVVLPKCAYWRLIQFLSISKLSVVLKVNRTEISIKDVTLSLELNDNIT